MRQGLGEALQKVEEQRTPFDLFLLFSSILAFPIGVALRFYFICVYNRPTAEENILGDAGWYIHEAINSFKPDFVPTLYDTLFPHGAPFYFGMIYRWDENLRTIDLVQWFASCTIPFILMGIASCLYSRRIVLYVFIFSSLYFPLWEFYGYFISEGPFIFSMYLAFLLLLKSLQSPTRKRSAVWGLFGGIALGASAACKSCSLFTTALVFIILVYFLRRTSFRILPTFIPALVGIVVILTPVSMRATRFNDGRFLLIANDAPRTFLLGHQGRAGLTWWVDSKRNFKMNFINPSTSQHNYYEEKTYPFGPYESGPNYAAGWKWVKENPLDTLLLSIEHVFDLFATALPWPGYFQPYARWTMFFNNLFIALILIPALYHLIRSASQIRRAEEQYIGDAIVAGAAFSIYILAFLFLGEGRYRISYDGFMILLAARAFFSGPANFPFVKAQSYLFDRKT